MGNMVVVGPIPEQKHRPKESGIDPEYSPEDACSWEEVYKQQRVDRQNL